MALDEMLIDELGIGPMWVRRDLSASVPEAVEVATLHENAQEAMAPAGRLEEVGVMAEPQVETDANAEPSANTERAPVVGQPFDTKGTASQSREELLVLGQPFDTEPATSQSREERSAARPPLDTRPFASPSREEPPADSDSPPFEAYDDLPWTDEAPAPAPTLAEATPSDVHTLDWDALADRVANCEQCRLCERRTNTVFGVGDREADWMLIGEAPGENEDKQGEPFVGQAGKLLDNMLRALGLSRDSNVYIANVIKCRPPGNRNPDLDEIARCEPYLQRQVELVKPKVIVALGRFAAQSLLKNEASISSMRGRVHEYRGVPVVVTYHPAYLLRSLPEKAKAWADLCLAQGAYRKALDALGVEPSSNKAKGSR
jgi:uracil-DNA glycosylase